ncbi:Type 12 methyltransferase [Pseudomonas savastanoi]|uniref:Carboxy-S-adenosyl-L-methionine synthase n=1 Tax=Pseudomonas savastanoi TaxID=29438 RepID=A0A3M6AAA7_PSESS|nr:Type 12 methyltransferase [Pseudomonas savastanoi]
MPAACPKASAAPCITATTWLECPLFKAFAGTAVSKETDRIFAQPLAQVPDFAFNEDVVRVFPDMIKRSVPGYPTIVENLGVLAAQFAQPDTVLYDLGSSLGAVTQALRRHVRSEGCEVIAIDNSSAMIERCREYLNAQNSMFQELLPVQVIEGDILALEFKSASVVALNFTLQFIAPEQRLTLLGRIRDALVPGGALILSEKLRFDDEQEHALLTDLHIAFKRANGYSDLEIAQKRSAIENVMKPDSLEEHRQRLLVAGFSKVVPWFRCLNFTSLIALP